jgi:heavy metal sensor kinase
MFDSVRARLTLWYTAILALVLIAFSGSSYVLLSRAIRGATDASLAATARQFANSFRADPADLRDAAAILGHIRYDDEVLLLSSKNALLASAAPHLAPQERAHILASMQRSSATLRTIDGGPEGDGIRVASAPFDADGQRYTMVVAHDLDEQADRLESAAYSVVLGIPLALLIAAGGGYLLARKSLAPVTAMSMQARQISAATLGDRIAVENERDELGFLATTLNELLGRLQQAFESQRRFMADASHELRTPIAVVQGEADVILARDDRSAAEYRESIEIMRSASRRLTRIVESLFLLARTDAGRYPMRMSRVDLSEAVHDCLNAMRSIAAAKSIALTVSAPPESIVDADAELLQQLVANLLDNALKFTPAGGHVRVDVTRDADAYRVRVTDDGAGIARDDQPHVFERFFRADRARSGQGAGLGLPIARWIAEAHGGSLVLEESGAGGTTFTATLPAA